MPNPAFMAGNFSSLATPIIDPLTGQQFPGNVIPSSRFSNFAKTLGPTVPQPNNAGANNYRTVRELTDDADTATIRGDQVLFEAQPVSALPVLQGHAAEPGRVHLHQLSAERTELRRRRHLGGVVRASSTRCAFGYNYAYHLNSPISLDGRNWVGDIGMRNLAGGTDPIDYGRPGFTMTGFSGNGEGGITQGATENIFSVSNATSWVKGGHNIRFGIQAQFRKYRSADRGAAARRRSLSTASSPATRSATSCSATARPAPARSAARGRTTRRRPSRRSSTTTGRSRRG